MEHDLIASRYLGMHNLHLEDCWSSTCPVHTSRKNEWWNKLLVVSFSFGCFFAEELLANGELAQQGEAFCHHLSLLAVLLFYMRGVVMARESTPNFRHFPAEKSVTAIFAILTSCRSELEPAGSFLRP